MFLNVPLQLPASSLPLLLCGGDSRYWLRERASTAAVAKKTHEPRSTRRKTKISLTPIQRRFMISESKTTTIASNETGYPSEPTSNIGVKRRCITAFISLRLRLSSWSDRWPLRSIWSPAFFYRES
jgi:hypothetical protein